MSSKKFELEELNPLHVKIFDLIEAEFFNKEIAFGWELEEDVISEDIGLCDL